MNVTNYAQFLQQYIGGDVSAAVKQLIQTAPDARLGRINPITFALDHQLDENDCISAFLHGTQFGVFELSWNVVCASCGGVLCSVGSLRAIDQERYGCALCATECEPNLDEIVEVTFSVDPRVRRIAAHNPESLPLWDYVRQIFWSSGSDLPDCLPPVVKQAVLDAIELDPGERAMRPLWINEGMAVLFDPVTHTSQFLRITGMPVTHEQELTIDITDVRGPKPTLLLAPGAVNLTLENKTSRRVMPIAWIVGEALKNIVGRRLPVLNAKRLLSHQTFRDLYRTTVVDACQRFKIKHLTFLFTDLQGSTDLYERIGDLAAFELIRSHFEVTHDLVSAHGGAVVKTIGDAVMATFPNPAKAIAAALAIRDALTQLNGRYTGQTLDLKIGIHSGPCLAVLMNETQDYFGQTVNIAARLQSIASPNHLLVTSATADDAEVLNLIGQNGLKISSSKARLRGITEEMLVCAVPYSEIQPRHADLRQAMVWPATTNERNERVD